MAVHAHPDDESSKGAATMAMYASRGVEVLVVTCTGGEAGDILNPGMRGIPKAQRDMAGLRRTEMARAAAILGVQQVWLGHVDSGLPEGDPLPELPPGCFARVPVHVAAAPLVQLIREFRPHVVTTYDENGGYPHPDHIMTHKITMAALEAAPHSESHPGFGPAWQPLKVYYNQDFHIDRWTAIHKGLLDRGMESPLAEMIEHMRSRLDADGSGRRSITTAVPCADFFEAREKALLAHQTQIDPNGSFFRVSRDLQADLWPTEDFELALDFTSRPPIDSTIDYVEDDLFDGIEPETPSGRGEA
ncbi:mycothiol conjugate amidase Mca [Saxibacter everestensis]|uniref:Mycothiol S-conjugate amidase n=1 Tax=Saxibacter everestensis TaxID=2909229 RepID=A0ABY8QQP4_9MICO|nr:mycothiol conjugate amidase Mca [Brevibacteriaceae bacterium ZFBP1038]